MSDFFMQQELLVLDTTTWLSPEACKSVSVTRSMAEETLCKAANSTGLKWAMAATASIFLIAAGGFLMCARTLQQDFVAEL